MLERFPHAGKASPVPDRRELVITAYPYRATSSLQGDREAHHSTKPRNSGLGAIWRLNEYRQLQENKPGQGNSKAVRNMDVEFHPIKQV